MKVTPKSLAFLSFLELTSGLFVTKYHKSFEMASLITPPFSITFDFASSLFIDSKFPEK